MNFHTKSIQSVMTLPFWMIYFNFSAFSSKKPAIPFAKLALKLGVFNQMPGWMVLSYN